MTRAYVGGDRREANGDACGGFSRTKNVHAVRTHGTWVGAVIRRGR